VSRLSMQPSTQSSKLRRGTVEGNKKPSKTGSKVAPRSVVSRFSRSLLGSGSSDPCRSPQSSWAPILPTITAILIILTTRSGRAWRETYLEGNKKP